MKCPFCGYSESKVIDSRPADENNSIRRRRECLSCAKRFTTYETVESLPMVVVKKDGSRQSFERRKVLGGLIRALSLIHILPVSTLMWTFKVPPQPAAAALYSSALAWADTAWVMW